jgi:hypothetical protein
MGYQSDVAFAFAQSVTIPADLAKTLSWWSGNVLLHPTGALLVRMEWVAWGDESDPEVDAVMTWLRELDQNTFVYIRIGGDLNDMECEGEWWGNPFGLDYRREIVLKSEGSQKLSLLPTTAPPPVRKETPRQARKGRNGRRLEIA